MLRLVAQGGVFGQWSGTTDGALATTINEGGTFLTQIQHYSDKWQTLHIKSQQI